MAITFGKTNAAKAAGKTGKPNPKPAPKPSAAKRKTTIAEHPPNPKPDPRAGVTVAKAVVKNMTPKQVKAAMAKPGNAVALVNGSPPIASLRTYADFKEAGFAILRRSVEAVFHFADLLLQAKKHLSKEDFGRLSDELSVASSSASQYMTIAKSERLHKLRDGGTDLPNTAHVLYLLASMDEDEFKAFAKKHDISHELETADVRQFRVDWKNRNGIAQLPKTTQQATTEATKETAAAVTAPVEGADPGEFGGAPTAETANGSPKLPPTGTAALTTFEELGEGILAITPDSLGDAILDVETAARMSSFSTRLVEHAELIRTKLADKEFDLQDAA